MRLLLWHVHGSWTTAFVQGRHEYVVPVLEDRGPDGRGRARTWDWPPTVVERPPAELAGEEIDAVVLQRPHEPALVESWLGRTPGRDLPAVYLEHDAPSGPAAATRHPVAELAGIDLVHVTHFNRLMWDAGDARCHVVEHGVVDPGHRYRGDLPAAAVVCNEPVRRGRTTGTDLLGGLRRQLPIDLFGMGSELLGGRDLVQEELHEAMARRRVYLHLTRWTSLGLSLVEAMHLGMPVVAVATTEAPEAVPPAAGVVTNRLDHLAAGCRRLLADPERAAAMGRAARAHALERYGLERFLAEWDTVLEGIG